MSAVSEAAAAEGLVTPAPRSAGHADGPSP